MKKIKTMTNFSGIGTPELGSLQYDVEMEIVGRSDISEAANIAYEALHGNVENFGDIMLMNFEHIPKHDLMIAGFPCQDISKAGRMKGIGLSSGTRSSLMWATLGQIEITKPDVFILENVASITSARFKDDLNEYRKQIQKLGYFITEKKLKSIHFGVPQNRERWFLVAAKKQKFIFPEYDQGHKPLIEYLKIKNPDLVGNYYDHDYGNFEGLEPEGIRIKQATKQGYIVAEIGDSVDLSYYKQTLAGKSQRRGRVQKRRAPTLTASDAEIFILMNGFKFRRYSARDKCLLQGMNDSHYQLMKKAGLSDKKIAFAAGNAMTTNVIGWIINQTIKQDLYSGKE